MKLKLAGYEIAPREQFQQQLMEYAQHGAANGAPPPMAATPVYADDEGNHFVAMPNEEGIAALPFVAGSKADRPGGNLDTSGGFLPVEDLPTGGGDDDGMGDMMSAMMQQMPQKMATDWVGNAAKNLMLGGGPGGMMDAALQTLGVENPLTAGPLGAALGAALQSAGLGPMQSLLPSVGAMLAGGNADAIGSAMGSAALGSLVSATGMGSVPGLGAAAHMLGSELGDSLSDVFSAGGLDELGDSISGFVADPTGAISGKASGIDPNAIAASGLDEAANYLASQWQVDDESSAAEHIAHKAVMEHKGEIQQALKDEIMSNQSGGFSGLADRVKGIFMGVPKGSGQPAVRIGDPDDKGDLSVQGVGNIKFQGKEISRITDKVAGPLAPPPGKQIIIGESTVLSAGLPTAFVLSLTEVPSEMVNGAATILVGGATVAGLQKAKADAAKAASNAGPAGPKGPKSTSTGSGKGGGGGDGDSKTSDNSDQSPANRGQGPNEDKANDGVPATADANSSDAATNDANPDGPGGEAPVAGNSPQSDNETLDGLEDGPMCKPEAWRDQLGDQLEDEENQMTWKDPTAKVLDDGKVDTNEHLNRNDYNYCPTSKPSGTEDGIEWSDKSGVANQYHQPLECATGQPTDGSLGPGSYECCYYPGSGELIDNAAKSGSYNFHHSGGAMDVVNGNFFKHREHDMKPHDKNPDYSHINMTLLEPPSTPSPPRHPPWNGDKTSFHPTRNPYPAQI